MDAEHVRLKSDLAELERTGLRMDMTESVDLMTVPMYRVAYLGAADDVETLKAMGRVVRNLDPKLSYVSPHLEGQAPWSEDSGRRIRVGFSSMFFKRHASACDVGGAGGGAAGQ